MTDDASNSDTLKAGDVAEMLTGPYAGWIANVFSVDEEAGTAVIAERLFIGHGPPGTKYGPREVPLSELKRIELPDE